MDEHREEREELAAIERDLWEPDRDDDERDRMRVEQAQERG